MAARCITQTKESVVARLLIYRGYSAASGKSKKGGAKGDASSDGPKVSSLDKEVKSTTTVGANILKDGVDPKVMADSEYPDWVWHLLDKRPALSELKRMDLETVPFELLRRYCKLENRARIKAGNLLKSKK